MESNNSKGRRHPALGALLTSIRDKQVEYFSYSDNKTLTLSFISVIKKHILNGASNIGLKSEAVEKLSNNLSKSLQFCGMEVSYLEKSVLDLFLNDTSPTIAFNKDGCLAGKLSNEPMVVFDLREIINSTFPGLPVNIQDTGFNEKKEKFMGLIKNNRFHTIKLIKKKGTFDRVECEEKLPLDKRLIDIMKDADFQNIEIKQESGKAVYINRIVKTKL